MTGPKDHACPECGAPRAADNTPSCACTERASEALRDAREAQAAAAEDFDPLRIRPYVELDGGTEPETPAPPAEADPAATMALRIPPLPEPSAGDIRLFEAGQSGAADIRLSEAGQPAPEDRPRGRRRTVLLLGAAAAAVTVVAAAGMASGLFGYETPTRDTARPEVVRPGVPDASPTLTTAVPKSSASPSAS
ncbi:peptidoglycan-binding protein, partial [Streptomyces sp. NPDC003832]